MIYQSNGNQKKASTHAHKNNAKLRVKLGAIINGISYWLWVTHIYPIASNNGCNLR